MTLLLADLPRCPTISNNVLAIVNEEWVVYLNGQESGLLGILERNNGNFWWRHGAFFAPAA